MSGRLFERENQRCYLERGDIYVRLRNEQSFDRQRWGGEFFREGNCMSRDVETENHGHVLVMVNDPFWRSTEKVNGVLGGSLARYCCWNGHLGHCQLLSFIILSGVRLQSPQAQQFPGQERAHSPYASSVLSYPALDSQSFTLILYLKQLSRDVILTLLKTQAVQRLSCNLNYSLVYSPGGPEHKAHLHPQEADILSQIMDYFIT